MRLNLTNLASIFLLICSALTAFWILFQPQINSRSGKTLVKLAQANFYIPSLQPVKIYAFDPNSTALEQIIQDDTKGVDAHFGIYIKNLNTNQQASLNAQEQFGSASLYKLFVMYTIYHKASQDKLDINNPDIAENLNQMITVSSNDAAYYLVDNYTSWAEVTDQMHQIGLNETDLNQDPPLTTPQDVGNLLEQIADGRAVNFDASVKMLSLMTMQTRRDRIPSPLPSDKTLIANKTGELDDLLHDAAVVGTDKSDYIIVLMSQDSADLDQTRTAMQRISEDVYNYFQNQWNSFPEIL